MLELLLYVELSCSDGKRIVDGVLRSELLDERSKIEIVRELKSVTEKSCKWDAND